MACRPFPPIKPGPNPGKIGAREQGRGEPGPREIKNPARVGAEFASGEKPPGFHATFGKRRARQKNPGGGRWRWASSAFPKNWRLFTLPGCLRRQPPAVCDNGSWPSPAARTTVGGHPGFVVFWRGTGIFSRALLVFPGAPGPLAPPRARWLARGGLGPRGPAWGGAPSWAHGGVVGSPPGAKTLGWGVPQGGGGGPAPSPRDDWPRLLVTGAPEGGKKTARGALPPFAAPKRRWGHPAKGPGPSRVFGRSSGGILPRGPLSGAAPHRPESPTRGILGATRSPDRAQPFPLGRGGRRLVIPPKAGGPNLGRKGGKGRGRLLGRQCPPFFSQTVARTSGTDSSGAPFRG